MRVGVVGCGGMGSWHAKNLAAQPGIEVVAAADVVIEAAEAVAVAVGATVMGGSELCRSDSIDAVLIASNDKTHAEFAIPSIEAGKPCFLEKPLAATLDQARQILDAEMAAGQILTRVGFMRELDPAHRQVQAAVNTMGGPAAITRVRSVHRNLDDELRPVNVLFAQSIIHDIHTIRWLTGQEFCRVTSHIVSRSDNFRDMLIVGEMANGALGTIDFEDQGFGYEVQLEVTTTAGMSATVAHPRSVTRSNAAESLDIGTDWFARFEDAYRVEIEQWSQDIQSGRTSGPTIWDGFAAQVVADAAERSALEQTPIDIELPPKPDLYQ